MMREIAWHEKCLANMRRSVADADAAVGTALSRAERLRADLYLLESQINEAKRRKMAAFDNERLLRKSRKTP